MNLDNIALFDLDGSLAAYDKAMLTALETLRGPGEVPITDIWDIENIPHLTARKNLISTVPGFWINLEPLAAGFAVLDAAKAIGYEPVVLTQTPKSKPIASKEKHEWILKHLGDDMLFNLTRTKGLTYGKLLFDDYGPYMESWLKHRPRGLGIMPSAPHNVKFAHPQVIRYDMEGMSNLSEVIRLMELAYKRSPKETFSMSES